MSVCWPVNDRITRITGKYFFVLHIFIISRHIICLCVCIAHNFVNRLHERCDRKKHSYSHILLMSWPHDSWLISYLNLYDKNKKIKILQKNPIFNRLIEILLILGEILFNFLNQTAHPSTHKWAWTVQVNSWVNSGSETAPIEKNRDLSKEAKIEWQFLHTKFARFAEMGKTDFFRIHSEIQLELFSGTKYTEIHLHSLAYLSFITIGVSFPAHLYVDKKFITYWEIVKYFIRSIALYIATYK